MPKPSTPPASTNDQALHGADAGAKNGSEACYLALKTRDARFDGQFFTGVTSTGIYCRPVCKVRTPKPENCRFFHLAAQAEAAGFRPCLRCRPELAPGAPLGQPHHGSSVDHGAPWSTQDASAILARQAAQLLDASAHNGEPWPNAVTLAARMGISERHLRRIFEAFWGITPLQYVQTKRLLAAKQWLTDTQLPMGQIATLSGYASLRRFNDAFVTHYRLQPRALRQASRTGDTARPGATALPTRLTPTLPGSTAKAKAVSGPALRATHPLAAGAPAGLRLKASWRPPYDVSAMLEFLARRSVAGVEAVDLEQRSYSRTLALQHRGQWLRGWVVVRFVEEACTVAITVSEALAPALPGVLARLRALLDLDADAQAINARIGHSFPGSDGLRVPGTVDGFELAVRAIVGQQVTVAAARTLVQRLVNRFGTPNSTPVATLERFFPDAPTLALASGQALGELGIVRQRQAALLALASAVAAGELALYPGANPEATVQALQTIRGIGPWTAHYIAMRALRWPDAFVAGDVALQNALGVRQAPSPAKAAEEASAAWRPWRSYAVIRAWHSLGSGPPQAAPAVPATPATPDGLAAGTL